MKGKRASTPPRKKLLHYRYTTFIAGILLVLVPTFFTTFPEFARDWSLSTRFLFILGWLVVAGVAVYSNVLHAEELAKIVDPIKGTQKKEKRLAGLRSIGAVLRDPTSVLHGADLMLYVLDRGSDLLVPIYPPDYSPEDSWKSGSGATGSAFESGEYTPVTGAPIADTTYGLSPEQSAKFAKLKAVAAMPVRNARLKTIAVLTASSEDEGIAGILLGDRGKQEHAALASTCGRLLIDLLEEAGD